MKHEDGIRSDMTSESVDYLLGAIAETHSYLGKDSPWPSLRHLRVDRLIVDATWGSEYGVICEDGMNGRVSEIALNDGTIVSPILVIDYSRMCEIVGVSEEEHRPHHFLFSDEQAKQFSDCLILITI